jgi:hypothetical protein
VSILATTAKEAERKSLQPLQLNQRCVRMALQYKEYENQRFAIVDWKELKEYHSDLILLLQIVLFFYCC